MRRFLDPGPLHDAVATCACGKAATANGRECPGCFLGRLQTVHSSYAPTRSLGAGKMLGADKTRRFERRLHDYAAVRAEGSQPAGTRRIDIDRAKAASDHVGAAVDAGPYSKMEAAQ